MVADAFGRVVTDGWGSASTGGAYALGGLAANFDVNGAAGTIVLPTASSTRTASLPVSARDVDVTVTVRTDKVATGSGQYIYVVSRRQPSGAEYRTMLKLAANGTVDVRPLLFTGTAESAVAPAVTIPGLTRTTATNLRLRTQITGANPTTIRIRAWPTTVAEPTTWSITATDSTAALQVTGTLGLLAYLSSSTTNAPVLLTVDDYTVTIP